MDLHHRWYQGFVSDCHAYLGFLTNLIVNRLKDAESTWLVFDGLDTFATVEFCGKYVASTNNQYRQYSFDVSQILKGCNEDPVLKINFGSAPNIVNAIAKDPNSPGLGPDSVSLPFAQY